MKLFTIRDTQTGKSTGDFFSQKHLAKRKRDELNGGTPGDENVVVRFVVSYGPDHRLYKE